MKQDIEAAHSHNFLISLRNVFYKHMDSPHKFTKWS